MGSFRDTTRDEFCAGLQSMGINAQMAERGRTEENIERVFVRKSLGLIDLPEGPISWVNIVIERELIKIIFANPTGFLHVYKYGVPDTRLDLNSPKVKIKSFRKKESPLVGEIIDLYWRGKDFGLGIIDRLNSDTSTRRPMNIDHDVHVRTYGKHGLWIISFEEREPPSKDMWNWFQTIANHLLADWNST